MELGTITIMIPLYETWQTFGEPRVPRSKSSVILDEGIFETVLEDLQYFMNDQSWYTEKGKFIRIFCFTFLNLFYINFINYYVWQLLKFVNS